MDQRIDDGLSHGCAYGKADFEGMKGDPHTLHPADPHILPGTGAW